MKKNTHISKSGFEELKAEWHNLKYVQRPEMTLQVQTAAAEGDRSENAAYTYGKMRLREIDQRLKKLDHILDSALIVDTVKKSDGKIRFGATVELKNSATDKITYYTLVGSAEIDAIAGKISMDSPMGKALMFKEAGDSITVTTPRGEMLFTITTVTYV